MIKCKNCNAVFANEKVYNMHIMLCVNPILNESKKEEKTEEKKSKRTTKKKKSGEDA